MNKKIILIALMTILSIPTMTAQDFHFQEVTLGETGTTFQLFAPTDAKSVKLRLYDQGIGGKPIRTIKMKLINGIWTTTVKQRKEKMEGKFYTFDVTGTKKAWNETPGVFAKAVGVNGKRACILDLRDTDPAGWQNDVRPTTLSPADLVIYEMHHRDFSIARKGAKYPGKFLALTEPWAISHLKSLGVNAIHILPSYDYGSVDENRIDPLLYLQYSGDIVTVGIPSRVSFSPQYNWGYDPVNYNVPEGSYSTNPYDPATRIREFKQMVQALHKAGIRVVLDVVYNHTYDIEHSNFQRTYPDYYYRKTADGQYSNGSGCGNETASDQPMMRRFMIESVKYWINEYHIDAFRFDLMGVHDIETMNAVRQAVDEIDPSIFIYGEGWSAGSCAYPQEKLAMKAHINQMPRIAAFSDEIRDGLRGPFSDDTKGAFLASIPGEEESIKFGIVGAISHPQVDMSKVNYSKEVWASQPTQMISYVSCHDDMCLVDRLKASIPTLTLSAPLTTTQMEELIRLDLLAQTAVFTSQGVPFMLSGEEMLRDKKGVHNSFESPDDINHLDWSNLDRYPQVFDYYKNLIALRKHHPAFRLSDAEKVRQSLEFLPTQPCMVAFKLKNHAGGDAWNDIIVVLNSNREPRTINVDDATYTVVCENGKINEQGLRTINGPTIEVAPQSATIVYRNER